MIYITGACPGVSKGGGTKIFELQKLMKISITGYYAIVKTILFSFQILGEGEQGPLPPPPATWGPESMTPD